MKKFKPGTIKLKRLLVPTGPYISPKLERNVELEKLMWNVAVKQAEGKPLTAADRAILKYMEAAYGGDYED